jgi:hypothetical protein
LLQTPVYFKLILSFKFKVLVVVGSNENSGYDQFHICVDNLQLRSRLLTGGRNSVYVYQCLVCGDQKGSALAKKNVSEKPMPFDEMLKNRNEERRLEKFDKGAVTNSVFSVNDNFCKELDGFLKGFAESNDLDRSSNLLGMYLTRSRDQYIKAYKPTFPDEESIKFWFLDVFSQWFIIESEVEGIGYVNGQKKSIRIDFVIRAKQELIHKGFTSEPLGIEVKFLDPRTGKGFSGKAAKGVFQALSYGYSNSSWFIPSLSGESKLLSILLLSNLSFNTDRKYILREIDRLHMGMWSSYLRVANHANVGEVIIGNEIEGFTPWKLEFNATTYFKYTSDRGFVLGNKNLLGRERIGNVQ